MLMVGNVSSLSTQLTTCLDRLVTAGAKVGVHNGVYESISSGVINVNKISLNEKDIPCSSCSMDQP